MSFCFSHVLVMHIFIEQTCDNIFRNDFVLLAWLSKLCKITN